MLKFFKLFLFGLIGLIALLALVFLVLPKGPKDLMTFDDPWGQEKELLAAQTHGVVAGTPWATEVALDVLESGGNAYDAAIAGLMMLYVTHGEASAFPGIAPLMLRSAVLDTIQGYIGVGTAPQTASIDYFRGKGHETIPKMDIASQLIPAGPDVIIAVLERYGTRSFGELAEPAVDRAIEGFPVHHVMRYNLNLSAVERIGYSFLMPYNSRVYLGGKPWKPIYKGERFRRPHLAKTLSRLVSVEEEALSSGKTRKEALQAVRSTFYEGEFAEAILAHHEKEGGLFQAADLSNYKGEWETPIEGIYKNLRLHVNGTWSQGIALPMALSILEQLDLQSVGQNSAEYIHHLTQAIELAMSDREAYIGDDRFVRVPIKELTSDPYGRSRSSLMTSQAFSEFPLPSQIPGYQPFQFEPPQQGESKSRMIGDDTSQIIVADSLGNVIAITPSDFPMTPMVPDWDITLGNRMNQFRLQEGHPAVLQAGKRPRVTPQAVMIERDSSFYMAINTPGGDNQLQAILQVLLHHFVFGDDIQTAIQRPRFRTLGFPDSFAPHKMQSATLEVEENMPKETIEGLQALGYTIKIKEKWGIVAGVGAIIQDKGQYLLGADPRAETVAKGR
ncbi:MAG: gamma-glutamyltransferase family protein [Cyanothece sp. SIO1E1]|nr:gamma-glutamyltransferase family protein [Cyanothece sp. SIO1E1]